jgi:nicotinamide mononucleotide transporter
MNFFDIDNVFFTAWNYNVSHLEFYAILSGLLAVGLSGLANVWSWPIGMLNVVLYFFLFFQVQLYPDMFLQVFFFVTNAIGWWRWTHPGNHEEDQKHELKISFMSRRDLLSVGLFGLAGVTALGFFAGNLHELFPSIFTKPSAFPYLDSFLTVMSIIATVYMIQKKIECWIIWLVIDIIATPLYFSRDIKLTALLYLVYCFIAAFALWNWIREYKSYSPART